MYMKKHKLLMILLCLGLWLSLAQRPVFADDEGSTPPVITTEEKSEEDKSDHQKKSEKESKETETKVDQSKKEDPEEEKKEEEVKADQPNRETDSEEKSEESSSLKTLEVSTLEETKSEEETMPQETEVEEEVKEDEEVEEETELEEEEKEDITLTYKDGSIKVEATLNPKGLSDDVSLHAKRITNEKRYASYLDDDAESLIYDIYLLDQGKEVEPDSDVKVKITFLKDQLTKDLNADHDSHLKLTHILDNGKSETLNGSMSLKSEKIAFTTSSFSVYVISIYEKNKYPLLDYLKNGNESGGVGNYIKKIKDEDELVYCMNYDRHFVSNHDNDPGPIEQYERGFVEYPGSQIAVDENSQVGRAIAYILKHGVSKMNGRNDSAYSEDNFLYDYYITQMALYAVVGNLNSSDLLYPGDININTMKVNGNYADSAKILAKVKKLYNDAMNAEAIDPQLDTDADQKHLTLNGNYYEATFTVTKKDLDSVSVSGDHATLSGNKLTVKIPISETADYTGSVTKTITLTGKYTATLASVLKASKDDIQNVGMLYTKSREITKKVKVVLDPATLTVKIIKKDEDTEKPLSGATFTLYSDQGCTKKLCELTTNNQGEASETKVVATQTVYLKETKAPTGYVKDETVYPITNAMTIKTFTHTNLNKPKKINISGKKTWIGQQASSVTIELYADGEKIDEQTITAGDDWEYEFKDLREYKGEDKITYTIKEKLIPGYSTKISKYDVENTQLNLEVNKLSLFDKKEVIGAHISLYDETDGHKCVDEWVSTEGTHNFGHVLIPGHSYRFEETVTPNGYVKMSAVDFNVSEDGTISVGDHLDLYDDVTKVAITKVDITDGKELPGAHLKVVNSKGETVDEWVSTSEAHLITCLTAGEVYTLIETIPADGYTSANSVNFTVTDDGEVTQVVMEDDLTHIDIKKVNKKGQLLKGAYLELYDAEGKLVDKWISDGKAHHIDGLKIGEYVLHETKAPEGYKTAADVKIVVKDTQGVQVFKMVDQKIDVVETGDENMMAVFAGMMVLCAAVFFIVFKKLKND